MYREELIDNIQKMVDDLNDERVSALLEITVADRATYDIVAKKTVHFTCLGNEKIYRFTRELVLGLEELEESKPDLRPKENIVNKLVATLRGGSSKTGLAKEEIRQHEWRVHASFGLLLDISKKRPLKVAMPLLAGGQNPATRKHAFRILNRIISERLGSTDIDTLKALIGVITAVLSKERKTEDGSVKGERLNRYALSIAHKIIEECENPLAYFAGPVLAAMQKNEEESRLLLDKILEKSFGNINEEMLIELAKIVSVGISIVRATSLTQYEYAIKIAKKAFRECENAPAYFLRNLILSYQSPDRSEAAETLLDDIRVYIESGGRLGKPDEVTLEELQRCLGWHRSRHIINVEFFIAQMEKERLWMQASLSPATSPLYEGPKWPNNNGTKQSIPKEYRPTKPEYLRSKLNDKR